MKNKKLKIFNFLKLFQKRYYYFKHIKNKHNMKKYWNFIILALIGGFIGLQEFYVGRVFLGILAILFSWTCIPLIVACIEAIYWLFMGESEFNQKFN